MAEKYGSTKGMTAGQKLKHYWYYYKGYFFGALVVLVVIVAGVTLSLIHIYCSRCLQTPAGQRLSTM